MIATAFKWTARNLTRLSMVGLQRGPHVTRYYMYARLREVLAPLKVSGRVLSIGYSSFLCNFFDRPNCEIAEANHPEYDMLDLAFEDEAFDHVVSDQVLHYVAGDPKAAIEETRRIIRPGGIALHTTCFVNPIWGFPKDYWRFTPDALRLLAEDFSEIIDVGGWGNAYVWPLSWAGLRMDGVPHARWHPIHRVAMKNNPSIPVVTWVVARK
ncbi:MAG: class I SAM-dependent methyltransferase [Phycisphaerales bacterium]|nr:MAG: class I SAM-dependent methyltransferase [Phycisphaerales bacterium]